MRAHNLFAYSVLGHRHEAEVLQSWREWIGRPDATARLMTHSGPFVRGIYLTLHAYLPPARAISAGDPGAAAAAWFREAYAGRPFVRVLDAPPELTHAVGTNYALIHAAESDDGDGGPGHGGDRQSGEGRRRPGDPGDEPGARHRGDGGAQGGRNVSMLKAGQRGSGAAGQD